MGSTNAICICNSECIAVGELCLSWLTTVQHFSELMRNPSTVQDCFFLVGIAVVTLDSFQVQPHCA